MPRGNWRWWVTLDTKQGSDLEIRDVRYQEAGKQNSFFFAEMQLSMRRFAEQTMEPHFMRWIKVKA